MTRRGFIARATAGLAMIAASAIPARRTKAVYYDRKIPQPGDPHPKMPKLGMLTAFEAHRLRPVIRIEGVKCDGVDIPYAGSADDKAGWVAYFVRNEEGAILQDVDHQPLVRTVRGSVSFYGTINTQVEMDVNGIKLSPLVCPIRFET